MLHSGFADGAALVHFLSTCSPYVGQFLSPLLLRLIAEIMRECTELVGGKSLLPAVNALLLAFVLGDPRFSFGPIFFLRLKFQINFWSSFLLFVIGLCHYNNKDLKMSMMQLMLQVEQYKFVGNL